MPSDAVEWNEDTGAQVAPMVRLEEDGVLLDLKAILDRFFKDGNQSKERGVGTMKLLIDNETGIVRLVMRQSMALQICTNHLVLPSIYEQEHTGNDTNFSYRRPKDEILSVRFRSVERAA